MKKTGNRYLVEYFGERFIVDEFESDEIKEYFFMYNGEIIYPVEIIREVFGDEPDLFFMDSSLN